MTNERSAKVKPTVLLVEDNADDELLAMSAMKASGIELSVEVARDGAEACDMLFSNEGHIPDLVLLDLKLPKISGLDVLKRIRAESRTRLVPVVILSSSDLDRDRTAGFELGANSFVQKGFDIEAYRKQMKAIIEYWFEVNQPCSDAGSHL